MNKKTLAYSILLTMSVLFAVTSSMQLIKYRDKYRSSQQESEGIKSLLFQLENRPLGVTCGILTNSLATELVGSKMVRKSESGQRPYTINANMLFAWQDSCLYESTTDSTVYAELYLTTYQTAEIARQRMQKKLPIVNEQELLLDTSQQQIIYDAGVVYHQRDNTIIQVAASNGEPSQARTFVLDVHDTLISKF